MLDPVTATKIECNGATFGVLFYTHGRTVGVHVYLTLDQALSAAREAMFLSGSLRVAS
jgi:hypothetical protein